MYLPIRASCGLLLPQFLLFADIQKWFRMGKKFRQLPEFLLAVLSFLPAGLDECTFQEKVSKISISEAFVGNLIVNYFCGREHKKLEGKPTFVSLAQDPEDFCARVIDLLIRTLSNKKDPVLRILFMLYFKPEFRPAPSGQPLRCSPRSRSGSEK